MYHYKKDDGRWLLCCGDDDTVVFDDLSIVYTNEDGDCSILKHGAKDTIEKFHSERKDVYRNAGLSVPILIHVDRDTSVEDVNFILNHSVIPEYYFDRLRHPSLGATPIP